MEAFIVLLSVVASVLSLILFFKIWIMTNRVKSIEEKISKPKTDILKDFPLQYVTHNVPELEFLFFVYFKRIDEAKDACQKLIWNSEYMARLIHSKDKEEAKKYYNLLKDRYSAYTDMIGEQFPTFDHVKKILKY